MGMGVQEGASPTPPPHPEELYLNRLELLGAELFFFLWNYKNSFFSVRKKSFEWTLPSFFFCVVVTKTVTVLASSSTVTGLDVHSGCKRIWRKGSTSMTCIRKYFHICALGLEEQGTSMLHSWRVSCSSAKYSPFHWQKALKLLYAPEIHFQGMLLHVTVPDSALLASPCPAAPGK